jgi:hypothetical protein
MLIRKQWLLKDELDKPRDFETGVINYWLKTLDGKTLPDDIQAIVEKAKKETLNALEKKALADFVSC